MADGSCAQAEAHECSGAKLDCFRRSPLASAAPLLGFAEQH